MTSCGPLIDIIKSFVLFQRIGFSLLCCCLTLIFSLLTMEILRSLFLSVLQVKVWNTSSSFCFVTFTEHNSGVTAVTFTNTGYVVLSASLDGTVRAFDLHR